jgi:L-iditol 2-dehydrogenase
MKAAVFEGIGKISVREIPDPVCEPDGIVIRIEACGICGSDVRNFYTGLKDGITDQVMGHEGSGTVAFCGPKVTRFKPGDRVAIAPDVSCGECAYCRQGLVNLCVNHKMLGTHWPGAFAQYMPVSGYCLEHGMVHPMPDGLSFDEATISEPASSVLASQENADVSPGSAVLVIGDGPIGCLHIEVARSRGAKTVIMAGLDRLPLAAPFGPDLLIDVRKTDPVKATLAATDGLGADVAVCANPVASTQEQAVEAVRKRGRVVLFGGVPKTDPMTTLNSNLIHYNELRVIGAFSYQAEHHRQALDLIAKGTISAKRHVTRIVPLGRIVEGFEAAKKGEALKVVVRPWE